MEQAILKVDFKNKKLVPNQQNNSDFYKNKHTLCDGEVTIFTTSNIEGVAKGHFGFGVYKKLLAVKEQ